MSIILKKPFVQTVLETLSSAQINRVISIINGEIATPTKVRLWDSVSFSALKAEANENETGINYVTLEAQPGRKNSGILVYTNDYCVLFIINGWNIQKMGILNINPDTILVNDIEEDINIGDFRRTLYDNVGSIIIPDDLSVAGDLTVAGDTELSGDLKVNTIKEKTSGNGVKILNNVTIGSTSDRKSLTVTNDLAAQRSIYSYGTIYNNDVVLINNGQLGQPISQGDFLDSATIHSPGSISGFEAFKIGQFVYVAFKYATTSHSTGERIFTTKSSYKIKTQMMFTGANNNGQLTPVFITTSGDFLGYFNISSATDTNCYVYAFYQIA